MNMHTTVLAASSASILAGLLTVLPTTASAQAPGQPPAFRMNGPAKLSSSALSAVLGQLSARQAASSLPAERRFQVAAEHPGPDGSHVVRIDHLYNGVRIFGAETVVVADQKGAILSESTTERRVAPQVSALAIAKPGFNVQPAISASAAIDAVLRTMSPGATHVVPPRAELIVYPIVSTQRAPSAADKAEDELNAVDVEEVVERYELAYLVRTRMRLGQQPVYHDTVVSAATGRIIDQWSMLKTAAGTGKSQYNGTVPLSTTQDGERFKMIDPLRGTGGVHGAMAITNANHGTEAGEVYVNASNEWGDGKQYVPGGSTTNANGQTAAVNAMWGLMNTYDMLKNVLNWHAMDGHNTATFIAAHVNTAYDNAYYSDTCKCMFIGDGSYFNNLASVDVVAHEMGHGVTASTSNLLYFGESGGLNESSSDIAGEVVEAYARSGASGASLPAEGNDWVLGKEISKNGTPLRWMYRPSKDGSSPDAWSATIRRLDVHYSSGPNNRMFYFLAQGSQADKEGDYYSKYLVKSPAAMTGIGMDKAYRIWFKAATTKFTATTNYKDARAKMLQAAQELYGAGSAEAIAVQRAYAAINVGEDIDEAAPPKTVQASAQSRAPAGGMAPR
jgi:Zn-dependent metalloprotease